MMMMKRLQIVGLVMGVAGLGFAAAGAVAYATSRTSTPTTRS
jgi:hypothetical protein